LASLTARRAAVAAFRAIETTRAALRGAEVAQHLFLFSGQDLFELGIDDFLKRFQLATLFIGEAEAFLDGLWQNLARTGALSAEAAAEAAAESAAFAFAHRSASTRLTAEAVARLAAFRPVPLWSAASLSVTGRAAGRLWTAVGSAAHRARAPAGLSEGGAFSGEEVFQFGLRGGAVLVRIGAIEQGVETLIGEFGLRQRAVFVGVEGEEAFDESVDVWSDAVVTPAAAFAGRSGLSEDRSGDQQQREGECESRHGWNRWLGHW
jgi:hypothetical protein